MFHPAPHPWKGHVESLVITIGRLEYQMMLLIVGAAGCEMLMFEGVKAPKPSVF